MIVTAVGLVLGSPALAQESAESCIRCHGDLELLRQSIVDPAAAAAAWIQGADVLDSAHRELACTDCHDGFARFPHAEKRRTSSCTSCHESEAQAMTASVHADDELMVQDGEKCSLCHGVHDVAWIPEESTPSKLDARCAECHTASSPTRIDRHRDEIGCVSCHGSHGIVRLQGPSREGAVRGIVEGCAECHQEPWDAHAMDVHGQALATWTGEWPSHTGTDVPPSCTTCHRPHDVIPVEHPGFASWMTERCAECHVEAGKSATDTYHIRARFLGSDVAASCSDCHGAHGVFPAEDERSLTSAANLLQTCRTCHEEAEAGFELYQPHPDPRDREKNPYVFYSFWFMNLLLAGVLGVFLLHTLAWWIRIGVDLRRASSGPGNEGGKR